MSQGPLCPNLSQKVQKEVSKMANRNLPIGMLYSGLSVNLNHLKKSERRKGIATALLETVTQLAFKENCDVMLFDVYFNNQDGIAWLIKNGFMTCGSLPHCGYVAGNGYTHALTMYKELNKFSTSDLISRL